jgi:hypothetical protein
MNARTESGAVLTWQERMPQPRAAFQCAMNCSGAGMGKVLEQSCGDCMPIKVYGDPLAARDAEIIDLRAAVAARDALVGVDAHEAVRYRWLRDLSEPGICVFYLSVGQAFKGVKFSPKTVDATIDAAIAKEKT